MTLPEDSAAQDAAARSPGESHTVSPEQAGERLDRAAMTAFERLPSRRAAYKAVKRGEVTLNGERSTPCRRVVTGDRIQLYEPVRRMPVYHFPIHVVFEDDWLAVIEKPPGIPVSGNYARTVERALPANLTESCQGDRLVQPRPAHRLDSPTGGILLVAKTATALTSLGRQFANRTIRKRYRALAEGWLPDSGSFEQPIDNRSAKTEFRVVTRTRFIHTEWLSTVDLWPVTGRTHQLRIHLADAGHPIVGDQTYGEEAVKRGKGLFLWAVELAFNHPVTGQRIQVGTGEPNKFASHRRRESRRWQRRGS